MLNRSIIYAAKKLQPIRSYDRSLLLKSINVTIHTGEWVSIIGHNGSGKSTLAKFISGLRRTGIKITGEEQRQGNAVYPIITQVTSDYLLGSTPYEDLLISYEQYGKPIDTEQLEQLINELLQSLGLLALKHVPLESLSGGERQLVAIAGALLMDAPCIILDEATSMLSQDNKWRVCKMIRQLAKQKGIAVLWITQQLDELEADDTVWLMQDLEVVYQGKAADLLLNKENSFFSKVEQINNTEQQLAATAVSVTNSEMSNGKITIDRIPNAENTNEVVIHERGIYNEIANAQSKLGANLVLKDVKLLEESRHPINYCFEGGKQYLLSGQNGVGKTTLLRGLAGITPVVQGSIHVDGKALSTVKRRSSTLWNKAVLQQIHYVPQHVEEMWLCSTIEQELSLVAKQYASIDQDLLRKLKQAVEEFGIPCSRHNSELLSMSLGEQKRVALSIAFCLQGKWLLLDEPLAGLDGAARQLVIEKVASRKKEGRGTIIVSHQLAELVPVIDCHLGLTHTGLQFVNEMSSDLDEKHALPTNQKLIADSNIENVSSFLISDSRYSNEKAVNNDPHNREKLARTLTNIFDPRALMLCMLVCSASLFIWNSWYSIGLYALLAIVVMFLLVSHIKQSLGIIIGFSFMALILVLVGGLSFSPLAFHVTSALSIAQRMLSLFIIIVLGLPLLSLMTPFRLQRALQQSFKHCRKKLPALDSYALLISLIFRFVPLLSGRWLWLQALSRSRFKQVRRISWSMLPVLLLAYVRSILKLADQLATSLELRGYDRPNKQPHFHSVIKWRLQDTWLMLIMIAMAIMNITIYQLY